MWMQRLAAKPCYGVMEPGRGSNRLRESFAVLTEALGVATLNETLSFFSRPGPGPIKNLERSVRSELLTVRFAVAVSREPTVKL